MQQQAEVLGDAQGDVEPLTGAGAGAGTPAEVRAAGAVGMRGDVEGGLVRRQ